MKAHESPQKHDSVHNKQTVQGVLDKIPSKHQVQIPIKYQGLPIKDQMKIANKDPAKKVIVIKDESDCVKQGGTLKHVMETSESSNLPQIGGLFKLVTAEPHNFDEQPKTPKSRGTILDKDNQSTLSLDEQGSSVAHSMPVVVHTEPGQPSTSRMAYNCVSCNHTFFSSVVYERHVKHCNMNVNNIIPQIEVSEPTVIVQVDPSGPLTTFSRVLPQNKRQQQAMIVQTDPSGPLL